MRLRRTRVGTAVTAALLLPMLSLTACGSDDESDSGSTSDSAASESPEESPSEDSSEEESPSEESSEGEVEEADVDGEDSGGGSQPSWALPVTTPGDLLTTIEAGDVSVEIYQVGTAKSPEDGNFVNPETNEPILKKGDKLVFVNYVITNNGAPIDLGSSKVGVDAKYADWKWLQGMDGATDDELFEAQGVNQDRLADGALNEKGVYTLGQGETYSYGDNFAYQKNSPIDFEVSYTPVDAEGELLHDKGVEAEGSATIK